MSASLPVLAYLVKSMAWSQMATAQRGEVPGVEITPQGRLARVKGSLSRVGTGIMMLSSLSSLVMYLYTMSFGTIEDIFYRQSF